MRRSVLAALAAGALAASLGGCVSLLPKAKPAQLYRFGADFSAPAAPAGASQQKVGVVLSTVSFPRASTSDGILTVTGDETAYIAGVRWVAPARVLFEEATARAFERRAGRTQILNVGDVGAAGAVLRIEVTSFEARYPRAGGDPAVTVALVARLTRADGRLLDQKDFSATAPAANRVAAIVAAFDQAVDTVLGEVTGWTDAAAPAVPTAPPPPPPAPAAITTSTTASSTTTTSEAPH